MLRPYIIHGLNRMNGLKRGGARETSRALVVAGRSGVALTATPPLFSKDIWQLFLRGYADHQSARPARSPRHGSKREGASAARQSAEARRLHPCLHHDAQEAELGPAEGRTGPADQRLR